MAFSRNHQFVNPKADGPDATITRPSDWNAAFVVSGATVGGIAYFPTATSEAMSGMTWNASAAAGEGLLIPAGTATTAVSALSVTQTWNNAGTTFNGFKYAITATANGASSLHSVWLGGAAGTVKQLYILGDGGLFADYNGVNVSGTADASTEVKAKMGSGAGATGAVSVGSAGVIGFTNSTAATTGFDSAFSRISAGLVGVGTGAAGSSAGSLKLTTLTHASAEVDISYSYNTPATGNTITTATGEGRTIVNPAGTLAALTITTPPSPVEGQMWGFASSQIITSLTITGTAGATVVGAPASLAVDSNYRWIYRLAITTWLPAP